jgi:hypothetical protein
MDKRLADTGLGMLRSGLIERRERSRYGAVEPSAPPTINLLYAPLKIPLVYCHIKSFRRASGVTRP